MEVQATKKCAEVTQLQSGSLQVERKRPPWLANARVPVLVGGNIGFTVAYFIGLYTIFHVAQAYKKLELKVCLICHQSPYVSRDEAPNSDIFVCLSDRETHPCHGM